MYDIVIKNGKIIDGTGKSLFKSDIGIIGEKIKKIGEIEGSEGHKVIDASGKYLIPGFIDTHSHADSTLFLYPNCESYLKQGITTFVGGNCGDSNAPIFNQWMRKYWEYDIWDEIDPFVFYPEVEQPVDKVREAVYKNTGEKINWKTLGEYFKRVEKKGLGVNVISLIGHSQLRTDVMGVKADRKPTLKEMKEMKEHILEGMDSGAWGFSLGRDYPPSAYGKKEEVEELIKYVDERNGFISIHWRRTGIRKSRAKNENMLEGIKEALEFGLNTGAKLEISHLASGFKIEPSNPEVEKAGAIETLKLIDNYIDNKGVDVAFDVIPGKSGGICCQPYLISAFLNPWLKTSGGIDNFINNLRKKDYKKELINHIYSGKWYNFNPKIDKEWDKKIEIINSKAPKYLNRTLYDISKEKGEDSVKIVFELIMEEPEIMIKKERSYDEDLKEIIKHKKASICTDTYAFDLKGTYGNNSKVPELLPHPHTYCAFPKYILEYKMKTIEETIKKITGWPAEFLGIKDRGKIEEGKYSDILIIDFEKLKTNENYIEPRCYPDGIEYVIVNGKIAIENNILTNVRSGKILKK